jgi:hypothetical protein
MDFKTNFHNFFSQIFFLSGSSLIFLLGGLYTFKTLFLLLNIKTTFESNVIIFISLLIFILAFILLWSELKIRNITVGIFSIIPIVLALLTSYLLSALVYDITYDAQLYHQEGVIQLKEGWNPVYEVLEPDVWNDQPNLLLNHYSKATWIMSSVIYQITEKIEVSKMINLTALFASLFLTISVLSVYFKSHNKGLIILLSFLVAFNPIALYFIFSFYVDGILASLLICLFCGLYYLYHSNHFINFLLIFFTFVISFNTKFTASAFVLITIAIFWVLQLALLKSRKILLQNSLFFGFTILMAIFFYGLNPYVFNTLDFNSPFYPLAGREKIDLLSQTTPEIYKNKNIVERLFISNFAKADDWSKDSREVELKYPFTLEEYELKFFPPNPYSSGFGPLFSGVLIFCIPGSLILFLLNKKVFLITFFLVLSLLFSVLIIRENWFARYIPQFFLLPFLILIPIIKFNKRLIPKLYIYAFVILLLLNLLIISNGFIKKTSDDNKDLREQLEEMRNQKQEVLVDFNDFRSNRIRLQESKIRYKEVGNETCLLPKRIISSNAVWCKNK